MQPDTIFTTWLGKQDLLPGVDALGSVGITYRLQGFQSSQTDVIREGSGNLNESDWSWALRAFKEMIKTAVWMKESSSDKPLLLLPIVLCMTYLLTKNTLLPRDCSGDMLFPALKGKRVLNAVKMSCNISVKVPHDAIQIWFNRWNLSLVGWTEETLKGVLSIASL